ncbi:MAG: ATP-binding cassette domain-containing protein [Myxococcota bacterium]
MSSVTSAHGLAKRFGGVAAVDDVSFEIAAGEVVALVGHNGAGKTTLVELLSGVQPPDAGALHVSGTRVRFRSPRDAEAAGIVTLHQELALADHLDVVANVFLGHEVRRFGLLDELAMRSETRSLLDRLQPGFDGYGVPVHRLSGGQRQLVAMARALRLDAKCLILDEPTAALGPGESERVNGWVRRVSDDGVSVLVVSHDLTRVLALAERVLVMRGGRLVTESPTQGLERHTLEDWILGRR